MTKSIAVRQNIVKVEFELHAIRIFSADVLQELLKMDADAATEELVSDIKKEYQKLFNEDFSVSNASMAVEIWAHVYAEKFAEAVKEKSSINFIDKIAEIVIHRTEVIDIGEKGYDYNRFVWDGLAVFKSAIAGFLFSKNK